MRCGAKLRGKVPYGVKWDRLNVHPNSRAILLTLCQEAIAQIHMGVWLFRADPMVCYLATFTQARAEERRNDRDRGGDDADATFYCRVDG